MPLEYILRDFSTTKFYESNESVSRKEAYKTAFRHSIQSKGKPDYWKVTHEPEELEEGHIAALKDDGCYGPSTFLTLSVVSLRARHVQEEQQDLYRQLDAQSSSGQQTIVDDSVTSPELIPLNQLTENAGTDPIERQDSNSKDSMDGSRAVEQQDRNPEATINRSQKPARVLSRVVAGFPTLKRTISICRKVKGKISEVVGSPSSAGKTPG